MFSVLITLKILTMITARIFVSLHQYARHQPGAPSNCQS